MGLAFKQSRYFVFIVWCQRYNLDKSEALHTFVQDNKIEVTGAGRVRRKQLLRPACLESNTSLEAMGIFVSTH